jgi:hypothetical protein
MTDEQRAALRRIRGTQSLRSFTNQLAENGLSDKISRQRLSRVEKGTAHLSAAEWEALADALLRTGFHASNVVALRPTGPALPPIPTSTPATRSRQWLRVISRLAGNRWWQRPNSLMERVVGREQAHQYRELTAKYNIDQEWLRSEAHRRLELGITAKPLVADSSDSVEVATAASVLSVRVDQVQLFVLRARLRNAGAVPWRDRLLYRIGPPVTSSLPFAPGILPVPDTAPNDTCDVLIPGRAQWFPNLAVISYIMVFPDCSQCLPGRLCCYVDTRNPNCFDHTLPLPPSRPDGHR